MFHEARAPTGDELQALLAKIITRILKRLTRQGTLIEEEGMTYLADTDADHALTSLQAASCTYRIALGPRAEQNVLGLQSVPSRSAPSSKAPCANAHGFSRTGDKSLMRECVAAPISAKHSNTCVAPSPARRLPTNGSSATAPGNWCCS